MSFLDLDRLARTPLAADPCAFVVVPGFVRAETLPAIRETYPRIARPGSFPLRELAYGERFAAFVAELEGAAFRQAIEAKFGVDLAGRPSMVTVRGQCGERDGNIHTDSKSKIITVLIYLNEPWEPTGGRLRLLRSERDLEDYAVEVPPEGGLMLAHARLPPQRTLLPRPSALHRPAQGGAVQLGDGERPRRLGPFAPPPLGLVQARGLRDEGQAERATGFSARSGM
jgi:SM-20-related protein